MKDELYYSGSHCLPSQETVTCDKTCVPGKELKTCLPMGSSEWIPFPECTASTLSSKLYLFILVCKLSHFDLSESHPYPLLGGGGRKGGSNNFQLYEAELHSAVKSQQFLFHSVFHNGNLVQYSYYNILCWGRTQEEKREWFNGKKFSQNQSKLLHMEIKWISELKLEFKFKMNSKEFQNLQYSKQAVEDMMVSWSSSNVSAEYDSETINWFKTTEMARAH